MKKKYDVVVVGAGPAGSLAARFAAMEGVSVLMLEKDRDVGYPVRCGEAVSRHGIVDYIDLSPRFVVSTINKFGMVSPDGTKVILPLEEEGYILERRIFDYELANMAAAEGAEILTRAYVNGLLKDGDKVTGVTYEYRGEQYEVEAEVVIGADGVESRIGRWAGLKTYCDFRDMECCTQITVGGIEVDPSVCWFYFGSEVAPKGYFWIFPKGNNSANIGLGVNGMVGKKRSAQSYLDEFMKNNYPEAAVLTKIAGGVPSCMTLEKISAPGLLLAGDAARQVNPLSGGGITSGMIGGELAGRIAAESVKMKKPDHLFTLDKAWRDRQGKKHETYNRLKEGIYNFSDEKFNSIAHSFAKIPDHKRSLGNLFRTALINNPSLLIDVAKVFIVK